MYSIKIYGTQQKKTVENKSVETATFMCITGSSVIIGFEILTKKTNSDELLKTSTVEKIFTEGEITQERVRTLFNVFMSLDQMKNIASEDIIKMCHRAEKCKRGYVDENQNTDSDSSKLNLLLKFLNERTEIYK